MKKELFIHFAFLISFFVFVSLGKRWFSLSFWPFWVGGLVGTILPDLDHVIYVYFLRPQELTSQRVSYMMGKRDVWGTLNLLADTRSERSKLIFHTALFQIIFIILTFWVMTSSGSILGRGMVLSFGLHLSLDQFVDILDTGNLVNWFRNTPISLEKNQATLYASLVLILVLIFGFFL